jgi:branched-chain amino acid transport system substrate-binding protein
MRPAVIRSVALVLLGVLAAGCDDSRDRTQAGKLGDTVTVGVALSLTGKLAREGALMRQGYDYCAEVVNQKGGLKVGNRSLALKLRYEDDRSDPEEASRLVDEMNRQGMELVLGPYGFASTGAVAARVEENGQVMVEGGGADDQIFARGYRNTFAVIAPASRHLTSMLQALTDLADPKPATVAIVSADDGFSKTAAEAGRAEAERQGMEVVALEYVPSGTTDLYGALTHIRAVKPDVVLGSVHLEEGIALMRQSQQLGLHPAGGFGVTVAPSIPEFSGSLGRDAEYVISSSQWTPQHAGRDTWFGTATDYAAGFRTRFGRDPGYQNADASAACLALVLAIQDAGSLEPGQVRDALDRLDTDSFFGSIDFDETGKNTARPMSVVQIQDGTVVTVWPTGAGVPPLRWPSPRFAAR